ncbi:hypothetical protein GCM10027601_07670 [Nocardioides ungokensis]
MDEVQIVQVDERDNRRLTRDPTREHLLDPCTSAVTSLDRVARVTTALRVVGGQGGQLGRRKSVTSGSLWKPAEV